MHFLCLSNDLATVQLYVDYINLHQHLLPLRYLVDESKKILSAIRKRPITSVSVNSDFYLHLRFFDSDDIEWHDTLPRLYKEKEYVARARAVSWSNARHTKVAVHLPYFRKDVVLDAVHVTMFAYFDCHTNNDFVIIDSSNEEALHEALRPWIA